MAEPSAVPLRRNRDFVLLQLGQVLSSAGTQSSQIAYPLLVLAVTHSPSRAGIVGFARALPYAVFALPAGIAADRWNRKRVMLAADGLRALAEATLVTAIATGHLAFALVPAVAFVEGACFTFFSVAATGAIRNVVPPEQIGTAAGTEEARLATVRLAGPPIGGALFGIARVLPFAVDAASYLFSIASLLAIRTQFQQQRAREPLRLRADLAEGIRFVWHDAFLRTSSLLFAVANFTFSAVLFALVVVARRQGLSGGEVGALVAASGAAALAGAFASGYFRRALTIHAVLALELWAATAVAAFVAWPNAYVLTAAVVPQSFLIPLTDSVRNAYRLIVVPDRLTGRVLSVARNISVVVMPLGPLLAGFLLADFSERLALGVFAVISLALAVWCTLSRAIRGAPKLAELAAASA